MALFKYLAFVLLVLAAPYADALSNAGKTFVQTFNFNHPTVEPQVLHAFVLATDAPSCLVTVTVDQPPLTTYTVPLDNTQAVVYELKVASTRGIKLEAPCDFIVYGLNFATQSADGWLAYPVEALGNEYFILGVQPWLATEPTQLTLVAAFDNTTCTTTFPDGTQRVSNLNTLGVDYITRGYDLTGTKVLCSNKVSVLTGQRCSNIPQGCLACDHTVEQVPPKSTLGRHFAMVPLQHTCSAAPKCCADPLFCSKCTEIYRVAAAENNTVVTRNGTETSESFTLQAGESRYILLSQTEHSYLVTTKPVLLGHYFNGQAYQGQNSDPAFAIIPQVESYAHKYQAATCFPQFQTHFVNLVVKAGTSSQLLLNGAPFLTAAQPKPIPGTNLEAFKYQFDCTTSNGKPISFTIEHMQNESFGLFAYGFSSWISYGYPGGMSLNDDVYYKCAPPQINVTALVSAQACNLTSAQPDFGTPTTFTDESCCAASGNVTLTFVDTVVNSTNCVKTVERKWTLTDGCGRSVQATQLAVIEKSVDTYKAPAETAKFKGQCSSVNASNVNITGEPELLRDCGTTTLVNFTDVSDNSTHVNRTWTVIQECTTEQLTFTQTITCGKRSCRCPCRRRNHGKCHDRHDHDHSKQSREKDEKPKHSHSHSGEQRDSRGGGHSGESRGRGH
jgi:hypothetical protein